MLKSRFGIVPIVAMSFLMVISVLSFFFIYGFFENYVGEQKINVEGGGNFERDVEIIEMNQGYLYINNDMGTAATLSSVEIEGVFCNFNPNVTLGLGVTKVNLTDTGCMSNFTENSISQIRILTNRGIKSEYEVLNIS